MYVIFILHKSSIHLTRLEIFCVASYKPVVPGGAGVPWHPQILADQLTLPQPREADFASASLLAPPDF